MTRHTKGPWSLSAGYHKCMDGSPADWTIEAPNGGPIAFLGDDNAGPRYERDANARLIAASPDLLAAAISARDMMQRWADQYGEGLDDLEQRAFDQIDTAIRKATGQ